MDGMPKPPPDYANQGPALFACGLVLIIVPTVAVAIRIWSRIIAIGHGLWWDDYLVLALMVRLSMLFPRAVLLAPFFSDRE